MTAQPSFEGEPGRVRRSRPGLGSVDARVSADHLLLVRFAAETIPGSHEDTTLNATLPAILADDHVKGASNRKIDVITRAEFSHAKGLRLDNRTDRRKVYEQLFPDGVEPVDCEILGIKIVGARYPEDPMKNLDFHLSDESWWPLATGREEVLGRMGVYSVTTPHMRFTLPVPEGRATVLEQEINDPAAGFFPLSLTLLVPEWFSPPGAREPHLDVAR